jgi:hypothetical protein
MSYKKPKRMFEDAGLVDPRSAYHVDLERVVNTKNKALINRHFSANSNEQNTSVSVIEY